MTNINYDYIKLQEADNILQQMIRVKEITSKILSILGEDIEQ